MSRFAKVIFALIFGSMIGYLILIGRSKYRNLQEIYDFQSTISEILDLEIRYLSKQVFADEDEWIKVNNVNGHIYSAYLDTRPEIIMKYSRNSNEITWGEIFIVALLPTTTKRGDLTCVLNFEEIDRTERVKRVPVEVKLFKDHWNLEYSAFFVICDLKYPANANYDFMYDFKQLPESIGVESSSDGFSGFVDIHYPKHGFRQYLEEPENFMAVCVPVLHHNFDRALELIEFIEYYRNLGIDHFTFYKSSVSPKVDKVLNFYQMRFIATVLNWKLPSIYKYEQTLRQEGLFAALNDCLYRNTYYESYKYIGTFDIDEFIVPRKHENLTELMRELDPIFSNGSSVISSFLFRNVYFYTMYQDDEGIGQSGNEPYLYTRNKVKRLKKPHGPGERSRYIARGWDTVEIGEYRVLEYREGSLTTKKKEFKELVVDPEIALLHHYAPCEAEETGCYLKAIEIDKTAQRFSSKLGDRVENACFMIFGRGKCPLPKKRSF